MELVMITDSTQSIFSILKTTHSTSPTGGATNLGCAKWRFAKKQYLYCMAVLWQVGSSAGISIVTNLIFTIRLLSEKLLKDKTMKKD